MGNDRTCRQGSHPGHCGPSSNIHYVSAETSASAARRGQQVRSTLMRDAVTALASRQLRHIELAEQAKVVGDDPDSRDKEAYA